MSQRVRLTWTHDSIEGRSVVEECDLMRTDVDVFNQDGSLVEGGVQMLLEDGRVMFSDSAGEFGLKENQIIKIEKLSRR